MLKQLVNDCRITFRIVADEPILIKSGHATIDGADMAFVQTFRNERWQIYIPGSSVKGLIRSHCERIVRTIKEETACNPFMNSGANQSCGKLFENSGLSNEEVYRNSCPICKMFGSTAYGSRVGTSDCYLINNPSKQVRDGVGIDRFTGGAFDRAKFDLEVYTGAKFEGEIHVRNFELWQLGLLGFVFQDLQDGYLQIGSGKSRGLGRIGGTVERVEISYISPKVSTMPADELWGVGALFEKGDYGFSAKDKVAYNGRPAIKQKGLRAGLVWQGSEQTNMLWEHLLPAWKAFVTSIPNLSVRSQVAAGRG
jgi:CRISPR-associated RAMP protein (TIGR02581 family)